MSKKLAIGLGAFVLTILASLVLVLLGMIYFVMTLWIVKIGSNFILGPGTVDPNWAVLSAALIAVGSMIGSALQR